MESFDTLVSVDELARHLEDPRWRIVDCRFSLLEPAQGRADYTRGHIPGAVYAHLDDDLAAPVSAGTGRHPLPDPDEFVATLRRLGICNDSQVVAYDDASGGLAARLWWMLRWLGHRQVAVLDGGFAAWRAAGLAVTAEAAMPPAGTFSGEPDAGMVLSTEEVVDGLNARTGFVLVDARAAARYRGELEPIDPVAGHVPGAINRPFDDSLADDGRWREARDLRTMWAQTHDADLARGWAVMCGSGVTACHLALSAAVAGIPEPRLYVGSWSEWIRDGRRPVARGPEP